jgi:transcriptional regulator with XRE-family HTH domain
MTELSELARKRLVQWMDGHPSISQTEIGRAIGHGQGWVSKYRRGEQEADIDELDGMARVFGHTLTEPARRFKRTGAARCVPRIAARETAAGAGDRAGDAA